MRIGELRMPIRSNYLFLSVLAAPLSLRQSFVSAPDPRQTHAPSPVPAAQNATPRRRQAYDHLTRYQKSMLEPTYNDWADLAKYRDADVALPPVAGGSTGCFHGRFHHRRLGTAWGSRFPPGPNFFPANLTSTAVFPGKPLRKCSCAFVRTSSHCNLKQSSCSRESTTLPRTLGKPRWRRSKTISHRCAKSPEPMGFASSCVQPSSQRFSLASGLEPAPKSKP